MTGMAGRGQTMINDHVCGDCLENRPHAYHFAHGLTDTETRSTRYMLVWAEEAAFERRGDTFEALVNAFWRFVNGF